MSSSSPNPLDIAKRTVNVVMGKGGALQQKAKRNPMAKSQPAAGGKASKAGAAQASQANGASKQGGVIRIIGNSVESYSGRNMNVSSIKQGANGAFNATIKNRETGKTMALSRDQSGNVAINGHALGNYPQDQLLEISLSPEGVIVNGINTVEFGGPSFETSEGAYKSINAAKEMGVTATLADKSVLESAKVFAEGAQKVNPGDTAGNEAATKDYLENMAGNDELRQRMIDEMAENGLGSKEELANKSAEELADVAFDHVMPKSGAEVEAKVESEDAFADTGHELDTEFDEVDTGDPLNTRAGLESELNAGPKPGVGAEEQGAEAVAEGTKAVAGKGAEAVAEEGTKAVAEGAKALSSLASGGSSEGGSPSVSTASAPKEREHPDPLLGACNKKSAMEYRQEVQEYRREAQAPKPLPSSSNSKKDEDRVGLHK